MGNMKARQNEKLRELLTNKSNRCHGMAGDQPIHPSRGRHFKAAADQPKIIIIFFVIYFMRLWL